MATVRRARHMRAGGGGRRVSARAGVEEEKEKVVVVVVFALPGDEKRLQHLQTAPASPFHRQARRMHGRSGCQLLLRLPAAPEAPRHRQDSQDSQLSQLSPR